MSRNQVIAGSEAEEFACDWLAHGGYRILERNWRFGRIELDIIAVHDGLLHVIEVKSLRADSCIFPEQHVTRGKLRNILKGASGYLNLHKEYDDFRVDIVSVIMSAPPEIFMLEDVYL